VVLTGRHFKIHSRHLFGSPGSFQSRKTEFHVDSRAMKRIILALALFGLVSTSTTLRSQTTTPEDKRVLSDFDIRDFKTMVGPDPARIQAADLVARRTARMQSYLAAPDQAGTRIVPNRHGLPKLLAREGRALTVRSSLRPTEVAKNFLRDQTTIFALSSNEIENLRLLVEDVTESARFIAFNQTVNGIDVFNGQIKFTINKDGQVIQVAAADVVPGLDISIIAALSPEAAVKAAFDAVGTALKSDLSLAPSAKGKTAFLNPNGPGYSPITAELSVFPMTASSARLAYRIFLELDAKRWYELLIDAGSGAMLFRHNLYVFAGRANVWTESPSKGTRTLVNFPEASSVNPAGWLPETGTVTTGNNVDAYLDLNGNDQPDAVSDPRLRDGRAYSPTQLFDFPFGDGTVQQDPRQYAAAAITNAFYFVNTAHDYFYNLGFNEVAGNYQTSNFNREGTGGDAVVAEVQWGGGSETAAFAPTPEGVAPKLRLGLFPRNTVSRIDDLDSSYDGMVVIHEYAHGVTDRLVGAKVSTSCLDNIQSAALSEGWSDYFAISFFNNPVQAGYISQNSVRGIRRYSYEGYPLTYEDFGNGIDGYQEHDDGEIWAATLWDLRKSLGAAVTDRLVVNGLKSTPCSPSMTDARDAILTADQAGNDGANRRTIWTVFARHGLGFSALGVDGSGSTGTRYDAAYDLPPDLQTTRNPSITSNPLLLRPGMGETYAYTVTASNPESGVLNYALSSGPSNMTVNASTGLVSWTATFTSPRVKITVTDGKGGKVVHGFALPVVTTLVDSTTIIIAGAVNTTGAARIVVPPGVPVLQVRTRSGTGDSDLAVVDPDGNFSASVNDGTTETLSFANPQSGEWQIVVFGYAEYFGVSLTASLITPTAVSANGSLTNLSGDDTSETFYRVNVPAGAASFSVSTSGGTGDVDVFLRRRFPAVCQPLPTAFADCLYDESSENEGNVESVSVTNPSAGDWYIDLAAYSAYSGVRLDISTTFAPLTLGSVGAATTSTLGASSAISTGYAVATVNSGTAPYGTAVFSLSQNGYVVSEAGVPASPPVRSARVFIEYRTGVAAGIGILDTYTGIAMANPGTLPANLTFTLRDRQGQPLATGRGTLPAGAHRAKFIHELRDIAPDFNLPPNFPTATLYGSLEITSDERVSVLGLRLTTNQRGETLLTSTAVADLTLPPTNAPVYFPQLADGGGYTTTVILTNPSAATQAGTISIFDDAGNALSVRPVGGDIGSSFSYSIPAAGTFVFRTDGSPESVRVGWARVTPNSGSTAPAGAGVFSYSPGGMLVTESGIPSTAPATRARIYIDRSKGHDTGIAISNPGSSAIAVTMQAYQTNGTSAGSGPAVIDLAPNGHRAAFAGQLISGLPDGFTGIADLTSSVPFAALTLRSLSNARGDFLLTTFPAPNLGAPAATPIVFPQIADGGGYTTEFIFISATGNATVSVNFVDGNGLPLFIGRTR